MEKKFNKVIAKCVKFYKAHKLVTWGKDHFNEKGRGVSSDTLTHKVRISVDSNRTLRRAGNKTGPLCYQNCYRRDPYRCAVYKRERPMPV